MGFLDQESRKTIQPEILFSLATLNLSLRLHIEPHNEYVVVGNDVLLKCNIPSFVADFVEVVTWVDSESNTYYLSDKNGNF